MSAATTASFAGKTVLVTGGAGFVGSNLSRRLLMLGARVVCFDNLSTGKRENIRDLEQVYKNFRFVQGDCNSSEQVLRVFIEEAPDYVYHYAAVVGVKRTVEQPLMVMHDVDGIRNVFESAALSRVKKVIFSSSSEAYGEPVEIPEREDGIYNAKVPYALIKLFGEQYGLALMERSATKFTALRFFNVYGPGQESSDYGFVAGIFLRQVLDGAAPTIFGDGQQTRDFVYIEDNLEVATRAMLNPDCDGHVINVGAGRQTTIKELAETAIQVSGKTHLTPQYLPARTAGEIRHRCPDVQKCRDLIGYVPAIPLAEGLKKTYDWYQQRSVAG